MQTSYVNGPFGHFTFAVADGSRTDVTGRSQASGIAECQVLGRESTAALQSAEHCQIHPFTIFDHQNVPMHLQQSQFVKLIGIDVICKHSLKGTFST